LIREANISSNPAVERWNQKYSRTSASDIDLVEAKGEPELMAMEHFLSCSGCALEVASGKGANALYLARLGYNVIASDCAINGLVMGQGSAKNGNLPLNSLVCDLVSYPFPHDYFDLVSVVRYLDRRLFQSIGSWVKPGGWLFYKTFNQNFLKINPRFNPDYVVAEDELNTVFSDFEIVSSSFDQSDDAIGRNKGTSFILARKPICEGGS
jgi:tellurite methyltransferase